MRDLEAMKRINLTAMTIEQLVQRFAKIGIEQDNVERLEDRPKYNRLYWQANAVETELRNRGKDERQALLTLYDSPNMQVRLNAATATLAVVPEQARHALQAIRESRWFPQAGYAGMLICGLDDGSFKPT